MDLIHKMLTITRDDKSCRHVFCLLISYYETNIYRMLLQDRCNLQRNKCHVPCIYRMLLQVCCNLQQSKSCQHVSDIFRFLLQDRCNLQLNKCHLPCIYLTCFYKFVATFNRAKLANVCLTYTMCIWVFVATFNRANVIGATFTVCFYRSVATFNRAQDLCLWRWIFLSTMLIAECFSNCFPGTVFDRAMSTTTMLCNTIIFTY